jgi:nucleoid DNA-binding protein
MSFKVDITAYIRELLFGHDCVIVPGFGGFIGNYTPARIDRNSSTFYPPVKLISFNRNLNHNDGLLIGKISGSSTINYGDARNLVEEFVGDIRRKLEKGEKVVFQHIGSFINNQEGNIQFEPDRNANYHLDSYGLESYQWLPVEGYDLRKRINSHAGKDPLRQASVRKILWRAAVVIPLLSLLVVVPLKTDLFKSKVEQTTLNPLVTAELEDNKKIVDEDTAYITVKAGTDTAKAINEPVRTEIVTPYASEEEIYCLITGSFKSEENALSQVNMLKAEGFTPEIVLASNGFYRVSAMICSDLKTATVNKDNILKTYPGAWISRKR